MSAINMTCKACGGHYIAGVVGRTPWPSHACPKADPDCSECRGTGQISHLEAREGRFGEIAIEPCRCTAKECAQETDRESDG